MNTCITVTDLTKEYSFPAKQKKPNLKAVDSISFSVDCGDITGFIGPNGAGKSTTIKMMSGILTPTSGSITVLGYDPQKQRKKLAYRIGTVFGQKSQLWIHLPPLDTFKLLGAIYNIDNSTLKQKIDELTSLFQMEEFISTPVRKLSLGQRIRCEIAASLLHSPDVLFLDEPTIGLDIVIKKTIRDLIIEMNKKNKTTILLTSHDISDIEKLCDKVIIINYGKIIFRDTMKKLKHDHLKKKLISIKCDNTLNVDQSMLNRGLYIVKSTQYAAKLEIDTSRIPLTEVTQNLMANNVIADMTIDDIPLEEIITEFYTADKTSHSK